MRISTSDGWTTALNNLQTAQQSQQTADTQVSTGKIATNLEGFGSTSEVIASYQSTPYPDQWLSQRRQHR